MDRVIKFRSWDESSNFMINDFETKDVFQGVLTGEDEFSCHYKIMQFTGLQDSKGVDIYFDVYNSSDVLIIDYEYTALALDGYEYFEDPYPLYSNLMITNRKLFVLEDNTFRVPIDTSLNNPTVTFLKDNEVIAIQTIQSSDESSEQIRYVSIYGDTTNWDSFKERVLQDGGRDYESNKCLEAYFNDYSIGAVDKIIISNTNANVKNITVDVEILEECKYEPDRKSTRLNSSHRCISYAVFCLKKKKTKNSHINRK